MRTIAVANQKGGCGKTTTAVNLAAALAKKGRRVLIVDLDPQGHSTLGFGYDPEVLDKTIYHALTNPQVPLPRVILGTKVERLNLAPSNILLSGAELELSNVPRREFVMTEQFKMVSDEYDECVIDCPPSLGLLTLNALIASTDVVVPVQVNYYAMEGLKQLLETANIIGVHFHPCSVKILGLLLTFVEERIIFSKQIQEQMREFFGDLVFSTVIHRTVRLAEAPSAGESVLTYAPGSKGATEYLALAEEILHGRPSVEQTDNEEVLAEEIK
jgi:chromosome partitioning protein